MSEEGGPQPLLWDAFQRLAGNAIDYESLEQGISADPKMIDELALLWEYDEPLAPIQTIFRPLVDAYEDERER